MTGNPVDILTDIDVTTPGGWQPIATLVKLAARLLQADVREGLPDSYGRLGRLALMIRTYPTGGDQTDIVIAKSPGHARRMTNQPCFRERRRKRAVWIIDSFRHQDLRRRCDLQAFDIVAYSHVGDTDHYRALFGERAMHLPWGTDALDLGGSSMARAPKGRHYDLLRIGRQPEEWEDDAAVASACATAGLRFHGRPPHLTAAQVAEGRNAHAELMTWYGRTRYIAAFCNLAAPAKYTHATQSYLTGRWTDALGCGASVLGIPPEGEADLIDWQGALVRTGGLGLSDGIEALKAANAAWQPGQAWRNHLEALRRLDWRWRLAQLVTALELHAPALDADIVRLEARISALEAELAGPPRDATVG